MFTHLVADVPLWTRMSALVAASTTEFTVEEQRWIAEAVADTAGRTAELGEVDREAANEACTVGDPGYALAGPDGIAAFEAALAPVGAEVASEAGDAATLEALHELVAGIPAETPVTCEGAADLADTSGVTLRTLIETPAEAPALEGAGDAATGTFPVTYESGGLTISARMSLPAGSGPFPGVVLVQPFGGLERDVDRLVGSGTSYSTPTCVGTATRTQTRRREPTSTWARRSTSSTRHGRWPPTRGSTPHGSR